MVVSGCWSVHTTVLNFLYAELPNGLCTRQTIYCRHINCRKNLPFFSNWWQDFCCYYLLECFNYKIKTNVQSSRIFTITSDAERLVVYFLNFVKCNIYSFFSLSVIKIWLTLLFIIDATSSPIQLNIYVHI